MSPTLIKIYFYYLNVNYSIIFYLKLKYLFLKLKYLFHFYYSIIFEIEIFKCELFYYFLFQSLNLKYCVYLSSEENII